MLATVIIILSVGAAMALTLPYPTASVPLMVAVYEDSGRAGAAHPIEVSLRFEGTDARRVRLALAGGSALGKILVVSNGLRTCTPYVGSLQAFRQRPLSGPSAPISVDADGRPAGAVTAFTADIDTTTSRQDCDLVASAARVDFSTYGCEVLAGYRFLEADGTQYVPSAEPAQPVQSYLIRLDDSIEEARFEGGLSVADQPNARRLDAQASALSIRWKDPHLDNIREFALFILAGAFALGISMLIELVKPRFLED